MKLYQVNTIMKEYDDYKHVPFMWFRDDDRAEPRPYRELIRDYDPDDDDSVWPKDVIDELFTEAEATALKDYLDRRCGDAGVTTIEETRLPISKNVFPLGALENFYMLCKEPGYTLPFRVSGYVDIVACNETDGSDAYHQRSWMLSPDGTCG